MAWRFFFAIILGFCAFGAQAQQIQFGDKKHDRFAPIEVTADWLQYNEATRVTTFRGNVRAIQDGVILSSDEVVIVNSEVGDVLRVEARGDVIIIEDRQTAQSDYALYTPATDIIEMTGREVILIQDKDVISGTHLLIDLSKGTGQMTGRVTTIFNPQAQ